MTTAATSQDQARPDETEVLRESRRLRGEGKTDEAMAMLRDTLRRGWFSPEGLEKAGRQIIKHVSSNDEKVTRVLLLGQCTTTWLGNCLSAAAWTGGTGLLTTEGQFDNVLQELMTKATDGVKYDAVVLLPWNQRLLGEGDRAEADRINDEIAFWQHAWSIVTGQMGSRLIQIGYDWTSPGAEGHHLAGGPGGSVAIVRQANEAMRAAMPAGSFFVDLDQASGMMGRERFYEPRRYYWTKQPFSEAGVARLAEHVWAGIRAMIVGSKKVLVLDLDNTMWGGVVGETGPLGIEIGDSPAGEAHRALQRYAKALAKRGCVLAVCSKNNPDDAREPFTENPDMQLSLNDFAAFEATWDPKGVAIERMAKTLRLGLDSFVFIDDNPAERENIRQFLPDVEVAEVTDEPSGYVAAIERGLWFESLAVTEADSKRVEQYRAEAQRREEQTSFTSMDDYLTSLDMTAQVRPIDEEDMPRVVQLIGKTNQFNLTTRRHSLEDVRTMLAQPNAVGITVRIQDRFGDYGLVAVIIGVPTDEADQPTLRIDTWLMSCRVIGRTAEEYCLNALITAARERGIERLVGEYIPTKKNKLVVDLFDRLGFDRIDGGEGDAVNYELDLTTIETAKTFIRDAGTEDE